MNWTEPSDFDNCAVSKRAPRPHSLQVTRSPGTTTVTYTATDIYNNVSTSSFNVTVTDDEASAIAGTPADITQTNDAGDCSAARPGWTEPTTSATARWPRLPPGTAPATAARGGHDDGDLHAADIHGNVNTASFDITVTDDENPCPPRTSCAVRLHADGRCRPVWTSWIGSTTPSTDTASRSPLRTIAA